MFSHESHFKPNNHLISFKKKIALHIVGILIFLMIPVLLAPRPAGIHLINLTLPAFRDLFASVLMIGFYYLNYYVLVPKLFLTKKYFLYFLVIAIYFTGIILIPSLLTGYSPIPGVLADNPSGLQPNPPAFMQALPNAPEPPPRTSPTLTQQSNNSFILSISHNILLFLSVILFSIFLRVQERLFKIQQANNQMEIRSLREQINPHFLFNMLNNIYGQAVMDNSMGTANSLLKLSGLLRHVVHEATNQYVSLSKELEYLENYVQLQRQRLGDHVELSYLVKGTPAPYLRVAPLILIPFIENAFKHGINPDEKSAIHITLTLDGMNLHFRAANKKANVRLDAHEASGAGIAITRSRLDLMYSRKYSLTLDSEGDDYIVDLILELDDQGYRY